MALWVTDLYCLSYRGSTSCFLGRVGHFYRPRSFREDWRVKTFRGTHLDVPIPCVSVLGFRT